MKVPIAGGGGREHTIMQKVAKSPKVERIYCASGNAGITEYAECVDIGMMESEKLTSFAVERKIDLTIVGLDDPLAAGAVDAFEATGLWVFGPRKNVAILEASEAFSKDLMKKYDIPTAGYETFDSPGEALAYLEAARMPIVLEADGLALGKGMLICNTLEGVKGDVRTLMLDKQLGAAGSRIMVEESMTGRGVSVLSLMDGSTIKIMTSTQGHKRVKDGDQGLNTDGMGTFSPSPFYTDEMDAFCQGHVYQATADAMKAEGREFKGIIFFGPMLIKSDPKALEYNARFGGPETRVVLPRMKDGIMDAFEARTDETSDEVELELEDNAAICVVLASAGYPEHYEKGFRIHGLDASRDRDGYYVFHTGSKFDADSDIVTSGGGVPGIIATGATPKEARANTYEATEWIAFDNKYMRGGIGKAIDEA